MSLEELFDHKCDIYHMVRKVGASSYGLPGEETFEYVENPDISNLDCHFSVKETEGVSQTDPKNILMGTLALTLPFVTDIRINDKVVNKSNNLEYTAAVPRAVRTHHMKVQLYRNFIQEAL